MWFHSLLDDFIGRTAPSHHRTTTADEHTACRIMMRATTIFVASLFVVALLLCCFATLRFAFSFFAPSRC